MASQARAESVHQFLLDSAPDVLEDEDRVVKLHRAINLLPDWERDLIEKHYFARNSLNDIAKDKGVSHSTISNRLITIRKELRDILAA